MKLVERTGATKKGIWIVKNKWIIDYWKSNINSFYDGLAGSRL